MDELYDFFNNTHFNEYYVYFNNTDNGYAYKNAIKFAKYFNKSNLINFN